MSKLAQMKSWIFYEDGPRVQNLARSTSVKCLWDIGVIWNLRWIKAPIYKGWIKKYTLGKTSLEQDPCGICKKLLFILSTITFSNTAGNEIFKNASCFTIEISAFKSRPKQAMRTKYKHPKNNLINLSQNMDCAVPAIYNSIILGKNWTTWDL